MAEPGAGRDQQAIERNLVAIGQMHLVVNTVETGGGRAKPPLRIDLTRARKLGMVGLTQPFRTCLESGERSYGSCFSSPIMVSFPLKPS
jgi:hypothetical protein